MKLSRFSLNPVFVIIFLWLIFAMGWQLALIYFVVITIHELGHYFMAKFKGYKLSKFSLSPYGVSLSYYGQDLEQTDELLIALAGPMINIISALLIVAFWWIFPSFYSYSCNFVTVSMVIALTNLLPAYPLDGGRAFICLSSKFIKQKSAFKLTMLFNILLSIFFFSLFISFCFIDFNPTYLLFSVFLILGLLDIRFLSKYEKMDIFNKKIKNFTKVSTLYVNEEVTIREIISHIQKNKTCAFLLCLRSGKVIVLSEQVILMLSMQVDIDSKLGDIFVCKRTKNLNNNR